MTTNQDRILIAAASIKVKHKQFQIEHRVSIERVQDIEDCVEPATNNASAAHRAWDTMPFTSVRDAMDEHKLGTIPLRLLLRVNQFWEPTIVGLDSESWTALQESDPARLGAVGRREFTVVPVKFSDREGTEIFALPLEDKSLIDLMTAEGGPMSSRWDVLATPVSVDGEFYLCVHELRRSFSFADALSGRADPRLIHDLAQRLMLAKDPLELLFEEFIAIHGFVNVHPTIRLATKGVILAAFSHPLARGKNGKIHGNLIGPPGMSKSIVRHGALFFSPIFEEVQPARLTPAGLAGNCEQTAGRTKAVPGTIVHADGGLLVCQEFHTCPDTDGIATVLLTPMELGQVKVSNISRGSFPASTGIWFDQNMKSQMSHGDIGAKRSSGGRRLADIGLSLPFLTRLHILVEVKPDPDLQRQLAEQVIMSPAKSVSDVDALPYREHVARTLDRLPVIEIPESVAVYLKEQIKRCRDEFLPPNSTIDEEFRLRMSNQLRDLVSAHARVRGTGTADQLDVDSILPLVAEKYRFIATLEADPAQDGPESLVRKSRVRRLCIANLPGKRVTSREVIEMVSERGVFPAPTHATIDKWFAEWGWKDDRNKNFVPTTSSAEELPTGAPELLNETTNPLRPNAPFQMIIEPEDLIGMDHQN